MLRKNSIAREFWEGHEAEPALSEAEGCQQVLYFCHSEAASAAEESAFLGFSAACLAVP